jgi:hypothetical protein
MNHTDVFDKIEKYSCQQLTVKLARDVLGLYRSGDNWMTPQFETIAFDAVVFHPTRKFDDLTLAMNILIKRGWQIDICFRKHACCINVRSSKTDYFEFRCKSQPKEVTRAVVRAIITIEELD